jgi:hypothetical protein
VPEPFAPGRILIPPAKDMDGERDWLTIAMEQQKADRALPADDRDNIGGVLLSYELTAPEGRPRIDIRQLGELPHYSDDCLAMSSGLGMRRA